jgi:hypothetical protein
MNCKELIKDWWSDTDPDLMVGGGFILFASLFIINMVLQNA